MQMDSRGFLWIGTKDGLQVFNTETGDLIRYTVSGNYGLNSNKVRVVFFDREERIWCGTENGLYIFSREQDRFRDIGEIFPDLSGLDVLSMTQSCNGDLLVGTPQSLVMIRSDLGTAQVFQRYYRPDIYTRFMPVIHTTIAGRVT